MTAEYLRLGSIAIEKAHNKQLRVVSIDHRSAGILSHIDVNDAENVQWGVK